MGRGVVRHLSLCSGIGGLDIAVDMVLGATTYAQVEFDPACRGVLERHWPDADHSRTDVTTCGFAWREADVISAGYPCQPFSHAGKRKGRKDERHLWPHVARAVRLVRPRLVVLENVSGHLSLGFGDVLGDLAGLGYDCRWGCVRASDTGMPHQRLRLFVVAADASRVADVREPGAGGLPGVEGPLEGRAQQRQRPRDAAGDGVATAADADVDGLQGVGREPAHDGDARHDVDRRGVRGERPDAEPSWGPYLAAVERWERLTGEPAPHPLDGKRLNPAFVGWMMGFPPGWTSGMTRTQALKALGNAVAPPQGILALSLLCGVPVGVVGSTGGLLPTPAARDHKGRSLASREGGLALPDALLPTPSAADGLGGHLTRGGARGDELLLPGVAKAVLLPTPAAWDGRRGVDAARAARPDSGGDDLLTALAWMEASQ